jgi:hypothetical protein
VYAQTVATASCQTRAGDDNRALLSSPQQELAMSFVARLALCAVAVAAISVLAALAWDGSDARAAAPAIEAAPTR